MARNTATFCLCTILLLLTTACPRELAADIRIQFRDIESLSAIQPAPPQNVESFSYASLLSPPCRFIELRLIELHLARPDDSVETGSAAAQIKSSGTITSCPTENGLAAIEYSASSKFQPSQWNTWGVVSKPLSMLNRLESTITQFSISGLRIANRNITSYLTGTFSERISHIREMAYSFAIGKSNTQTESISTEHSEAAPRNNVSQDVEESDNSSETIDSYWEYYQDCDNWNVNFALITMKPLLPITLVTISDELEPQSQFRFHLARALATRNLFLLFAPGRKALYELRNQIELQIRHQEFLVIESRKFPLLEVDGTGALNLGAINAESASPAITTPILLAHAEWAHPGSVIEPSAALVNECSRLIANQLNPIAVLINSLNQRVDVQTRECELTNQTRLAERRESDRR